ncbi:MAG: hypothetical protein AAGM21_06545 [Pseudomonadota bacterium]
MDNVLLFDMFTRMAVVLCAAAVAGLALQRFKASTSSNKYLYATVGLVTGTLSLIGFADVLSGQPTHPFVVIASLLSPLGWAVTLWVAWTPSRHMYYFASSAYGGSAGVRRDRALKQRRTGKEAVLAVVDSPVNVTADPVFRSIKPVARPDWPMPLTLEFLPGTDRQR